MDELIARAEGLPELLAADAHLRHRGRFTNVAFLMQIGDAQFHADMRNGSLVSFTRGPLLMRSWRFALRGDADAWSKFWQSCPPPNFHDILALTKFRTFTLEGDLHPLLSNLLFFKDLFALPRSTGPRA
jgi:hypothetical protein